MYSADVIIDIKNYLTKANDEFNKNNSKDKIYYLEKTKALIDEAIRLATEEHKQL